MEELTSLIPDLRHHQGYNQLIHNQRHQSDLDRKDVSRRTTVQSPRRIVSLWLISALVVILVNSLSGGHAESHRMPNERLSPDALSFDEVLQLKRRT